MAEEIAWWQMILDPESQLPVGPDNPPEPSSVSPTDARGAPSLGTPPRDKLAPATLSSDAPLHPFPNEAQLEPSPLGGDPISYAAVSIPQPVEYSPEYWRSSLQLPDDLRISWSWWHLLLFVCAAVASPFVIPLAMALVIAMYTHDSAPHIQAMFANPGFLIAAQLLLFAALFFFLYITLAVLRDAPFWRTLGWRKLSDRVGNRKPWMFLVWGSGLALFVAVASSRVKGTENAPIEELFKDPHSALLLMAMAVFVAPLVEETVFRGYLYPLFAGGFSRAAARFGMDSPRGALWHDQRYPADGIPLRHHARFAAGVELESGEPADAGGCALYLCAGEHGHGAGQLSDASRVQLADCGVFHSGDQRLSAHAERSLSDSSARGLRGKIKTDTTNERMGTACTLHNRLSGPTRGW